MLDIFGDLDKLKMLMLGEFEEKGSGLLVCIHLKL